MSDPAVKMICDTFLEVVGIAVVGFIFLYLNGAFDKE
jgi:hypothetical protein